MDLYHIHTHGVHDKMFKEGSIIDINDKFNNRLYKRVMNSSVSIPSNNFKEISNNISEYFNLENEIPMTLVLDFINNQTSVEEMRKALKEAKRMLYNFQVLKRELSLENYRKDNASDKPSRLHSMYACTEEGINYWSKHIIDNNVDIYRIDAENIFVTNEELLPAETSSYLESYNKAVRYFNPKNKNIGNEKDEILITGKVQILEKVDEIIRK